MPPRDNRIEFNMPPKILNMKKKPELRSSSKGLVESKGTVENPKKILRP